MQVVDFEFDDASRVASARIADGWAELCSPDNFGFAALQAFLEQRAEHQRAPEIESIHAPVPTARAELFAEALSIIREAQSLMEGARAQEAAEPAETTVSDPHRHVTISLAGGQPTWLEINQSWLRHAEPHQVETDLVTALNAALDHRDETRAGLAKLSQRHRRLVDQRNENWR